MVDYSKFDHINDTDDETLEADAKPKQYPSKIESVPSIACDNCAKACAKPLRCGKCKVAAYCSSLCQKQDWRFHKRNCQEPISMQQTLQQKFPGSLCLGAPGQLSQPIDQSTQSQIQHQQGEAGSPTVAKPSEEVLEQEILRSEPLIDSQIRVAFDEAIKSVQETDRQPMQQLEHEEARETSEQQVVESSHAIHAEVNRGLSGMDPPVSERSAVVDRNITAGLEGDLSQNERCKNCTQRCPKPLRCSVCKEATYCSAMCQKEDWRLHKSECKRPKPKVLCISCSAAFKDNTMFCNTCGARRPDEEQAMGQPEPIRQTQCDTEKIENEEVEEWYRHREWQPEVKQSFCPERIDAELKVNDPETHKHMDAEATCATTEAATGKDMLPWWKQRLASMQIKCDESESPAKVEVEKVIDVTGEASISYDKDRACFSFDIKFRLLFDVETEETTASGFVMQTTSCGQIHVSSFSHKTRGDCHMKVAGTDLAVKFAEGELLPKLKDALLECIADYEKEH